MRLFTGIALPQDASDRITNLIAELHPHADLAWTPAGKLHVTIKFIGDWPQARLPELQSVLSKLTAPSPIDIAIRRIGWLPNPRAAHILYAGVESTEPLLALASSMETALGALGIPKETRVYRPHVTLARVPDRSHAPLDPLRAAIATHELAHFAVFRATAFHLYLSNAGQYTKLSEYPLPAA
ncbi:MAG: RNA 2',3'-cyclic phosphodiesterase [Acidobacteriota bacterium]